MGIERPASSRADEIEIGATGADVRIASDWLETTCRRHDVPRERIERLALCLNEALANIIEHGGREARATPIRVRLEVRPDADARVTVSDTGIAFDPRSVAQKPLPKSLAEAEPGGLGLVMIRKLSDCLDYRREAGRNHFTFGARWEHP